MTPQEVVATWLRRLWKERDATAIDEMRAPGATSSGLGPDPMDNDTFRHFHALGLAAFPEVEIVPTTWIVQGERVALGCEFRATTVDGRHVRMRGMGIVEVNGDKVVHVDNHWDVGEFAATAGLSSGPHAFTDVFLRLISQLGITRADGRA